MKLSTLLLSSAALVVAGSAYAADLPAKKGAPAKAATGCPAFGAGFFQIPGGDTCIKFGGYVRAQYGARSATNSTNKLSSAAQLTVDAASNSEIGAVKSSFGLANSGSGLEWAHLSAGGITAGLKYSETDFDQGTISQQIGGSYTVNSLLYTAALGSSSLTVGIEDNAQGNTTYNTYRPDVVASLSTSAGPAALSLAAASTAPRSGNSETGTEGQGYAVTALAKVSAGPATIALYGGYAYGASRTVANSAVSDFDGTNYSKASAVGVKASVPVGNGKVNLLAGQEVTRAAGGTSDTTTTRYAAQYAITVAKGLTVTPELASSNNGTTTTNGGYLRIQRDF